MSPSTAPLPSRFVAALAALDVRPGHRVLEIGCGHGVLAEALCRRVGPDGQVDALDRSSKMTAAAAARNRDAIDEGRLRLHTDRVQNVILDHGVYDRIVAVRVRELWDDAAGILPRIVTWLRASGLLCVVVDAPAASRASEDIAAAASALTAFGFAEVAIERTKGMAAITARPR